VDMAFSWITTSTPPRGSGLPDRVAHGSVEFCLKLNACSVAGVSPPAAAGLSEAERRKPPEFEQIR